ncbi:MAG TPA: hypothetical protein VHG91_12730, partial [Longimicrobium sp.]|nr:hypothetical protein [Longimicrobium sp.]
MVIRTSTPPARDCASTPGTPRSAWSIRSPPASSTARRSTTVTASGTSRTRAGVRVATAVTSGRRCGRVSRPSAGACAASGGA